MGVNRARRRYTKREVLLLARFILCLTTATTVWLAASADNVHAQDQNWRAPSGFQVEKRGSVTWRFHRRTASAVRPLQYSWTQQWQRLSNIFGTRIADNIEVRVGRDAEEMRRLAPADLPPPPGAIGVAYPGRGIMVLALSHAAAPDGTKLDKTFVHEMAHLALYRATLGKDGRPADIPRWFTEGVAIHLADEASLERFQKMAVAAWAGELIPLQRLSARFPRLEHQVTLAYAQSASFVSHMLDGEQDQTQFAKLLERLREGETFESAVSKSYGVSLQYLEREWRQVQHDRFAGLPLLLSGGGIWALGFVVILFGYMRKRRRTRAKLARWEEEEARQSPTEVVPLRPIMSSEPGLESTSGGQTSTHGEQTTTILLPARQTGDVSIPTVEFEGKTHTLH